MVNNLKLLIKSNLKTFISIMLLTMLGVGFLVGMKSSVPNLINTITNYYEKYHVFDLELSSSIGFMNEDIATIAKIPGITEIYGGYQKDFLVKSASDEYVIRIHSYSESNNINNLELIDGNYPKNSGEIVIEEPLLNNLHYKIGDIIILDNELLNNKEYKIVGVIKSPLYLSNNRGSTNLLSGKVNYYGFINVSNIESDLYSSIYIKIDETKKESIINEINKVGKNVFEVRYVDTIKEYQEKIENGESEFKTRKRETEDRIRQYEDEIENAELQIVSAEKSIPTVEEARKMLADKKNALSKVKAELDKAKAQIDSAKEEYNNSKAEYDNAKAMVDKARNEINQIKVELSRDEQEIRNLENELQTASPERQNEINNLLNQKREDVENKKSEISFTETLIDYYDNSLNTYKKELDDANEKLSAKQYEYDLAKQEYDKVERSLNANSPEELINIAKKELESKKRLLNQKKEELEENKKKVLSEFERYQDELNDAKDYLKFISVSSWSIGEREDIPSYNQFLNDIRRIQNIGNFFPIIFYMVAVLITLTNISRIITKDRDKIGLYKSLGYTSYNISKDYLLFALLSCLLGSFLGVLLGSFLLPVIFYNVYKILYFLPPLKLLISYNTIVLATAIAVLLVVFSAYFSIKSTVKEWPAILLRPKENKKNRRIILEYIPFIWKKMSFTNKVSFRNMFKYPKRFIMTILGVTGCISLIIAGFNIKTAISNIIPLQFENLFDIDVEIFMKDGVSRSEILEERERIANLEEIDSTILSYVKYVYSKDDNVKANLVVPEDNDLLQDFVVLKSGNNTYELSDNGVIITKKYASLLNTKEGEYVSFRDSDNNVFEVFIDYIVDNYVDNYVYMSKHYYNELLGNYPKYNALLARTSTKMRSEELLSSKLNEENKISYLIYTSVSKVMYDSLTKSLNFIVLILVVSAVILAFVVLYNLNSLNVEERKREIATIKVLGFFKKETNHYIENEIMRITIMGIILGIIFGYFFSNILIKSCELDNLMYDYSIHIQNYLYAIIITIIFMIITSMLGRRNIEKIDMIESLKKVE